MDLIWKTTVVYFLILVIMRVMGKREIGQLSLFDFVVLLLIADISAMAIDAKSDFLLYLLPIIVLTLIQKILAYAALKIKCLRKVFDGSEVIIINDGRLDIKQMKKQFYNVDDLLTQIRLKNVKSLSQIRYLILENNGEISIFLYEEEDLRINSKSKTINVNGMNNSSTLIKNKHDLKSIFPIITSGVINKDYLKIINKDEEWVKKEIARQGYKDYKKIYYASYEHDELFIMKTI